MAKGARIAEAFEGTINEVASVRDGAYEEASGGRRDAGIPRSVGTSKDKR
jgi:hypothetical protein